VHDALASSFIVQRPLDRFDLAANAANAGEQLFLFSDCVCHCGYIGYPPIPCQPDEGRLSTIDELRDGHRAHLMEPVLRPIKVARIAIAWDRGRQGLSRLVQFKMISGTLAESSKVALMVSQGNAVKGCAVV
jgi:hypothetical protein